MLSCYLYKLFPRTSKYRDSCFCHYPLLKRLKIYLTLWEVYLKVRIRGSTVFVGDNPAGAMACLRGWFVCTRPAGMLQPYHEYGYQQMSISMTITKGTVSTVGTFQMPATVNTAENGISNTHSHATWDCLFLLNEYHIIVRLLISYECLLDTQMY